MSEDVYFDHSSNHQLPHPMCIIHSDQLKLMLDNQQKMMNQVQAITDEVVGVVPADKNKPGVRKIIMEIDERVSTLEKSHRIRVWLERTLIGSVVAAAGAWVWEKLTRKTP